MHVRIYICIFYLHTHICMGLVVLVLLVLKQIVCMYVIVVTWARGICLICMPEAQGLQARGLRTYTSGKSRVHMLQVICNTSGTLKICPNFTSIFPPLYIVTGSRCDCGTLFHRCHDVLAW